MQRKSRVAPPSSGQPRPRPGSTVPYKLRRTAIALALATAFSAAGAAGFPVLPVADTPAPSQGARSMNFAIGAGDLGQALDTFSRQGAMRVDYPPELVKGKRSGGVSGQYTPEVALRKLLLGTGIVPLRIDEETFVLRPDGSTPPSSGPGQSAPKTPPASGAQARRDAEPTTLQTIAVTGSLIPQAQIETATPTITLRPEQMQRSGFGSVYTALRALPVATGAVEDNQRAMGGFTPGAESLSLLGLDPAFTLYLVDGHPLTSYPLLYKGRSNFVDLGDIPMGMIDRIDIVPGNLSSIYGSSAIAGVVNIILKHHVDGYELNARAGGYTEGGGRNERLQFIGGYDNDKVSLVYGLQYNHQSPIWGYQRKLTASSAANPDPSLRYGYYTFVHEYLSPSYYPVYEDPGDACKSVAGLYKGTTMRWSQPNLGAPIDANGAPTGPGYYCGTANYIGYSTILNQVRSGAGYLDFSYKINDDVEAYANVLYNVDVNEVMYGYNYWESNKAGGSYFWNGATNRFETMFRFFSPEETGSWHDTASAKYLTRAYNAWVGVRGDAGNLHYDVSYTRSQQTLDERIPWLLTDKVNAFFQEHVLGPQLGTTSGYPIYDPNLEAFYKPITPAEYATFNGIQQDHNETWVQSINAQVSNGSLFSLPGGDAGAAAVVQFGNQNWSNPTDPRVVAGDFYGLTGTQGGGTRRFWAAAGEFRAPITRMLTLDVSGRYDQYNNHGGGSDGRATYKVGLEFRPIDDLLFRGNYATAFRAPDMAYVFGGESGVFRGSKTDYYRCDQYGGPLVNCPYYRNQHFFELHTGNHDLKSVTAKSFGFGAVWSPTSDFDLKVDYYNIKVGNEVALQSDDSLLQTEAQCRTGQLDVNSAICQTSIAQVLRNPPGSIGGEAINTLIVKPINISRERVSGIIAGASYEQGLGRYGKLTFRANYNVTLKHTFQQDVGDPTVDLLRQPDLPPYSTEFKTIANGSITWDVGRWSATLFGTRYGATPNYAALKNGYGTHPAGYNGQAAGTNAPWILYNGSLTYKFNKQLSLSGIVNNIRNTMPPLDESYVAFPYYNHANYNPYGRELWVELDWRFGAK